MNKWITGSMITFFLVACACSTQSVETSGLVLQPFAPFEVRDDMLITMGEIDYSSGGGEIVVIDPVTDTVAGKIRFSGVNGGYVSGAAIGNGRIYVINEGNPRYPATEIYVVYPAQGKGKTISMGKTPKGGIIGIQPLSVLYAKKARRFLIGEAWMGVYMIFDGENDTYLGYMKNEWTKTSFLSVEPIWLGEEEYELYGICENNEVVKWRPASPEEKVQKMLMIKGQEIGIFPSWSESERYKVFHKVQNYLVYPVTSPPFVSLEIYNFSNNQAVTNIFLSNLEIFPSSCHAYFIDIYPPSNWLFVEVMYWTNTKMPGEPEFTWHLIDLNTFRDIGILSYDGPPIIRYDKIYVRKPIGHKRWENRIRVYYITNCSNYIKDIWL